jgi:predicted Fe-Mo cluster-binding NifX family protein
MIGLIWSRNFALNGGHEHCYALALGGRWLMKVALTVWEDRISPVADSARQLLVADIGDQTIRDRQLEHFDIESPFDRARKLVELQVRTFICGAISNFYANLVEGYGIRLIPFIRGEVDDVLDSYLQKSLLGQKFRMTGCPYDESESER